jgi:hypothetical protein
MRVGVSGLQDYPRDWFPATVARLVIVVYAILPNGANPHISPVSATASQVLLWLR